MLRVLMFQGEGGCGIEVKQKKSAEQSTVVDSRYGRVGIGKGEGGGSKTFIPKLEQQYSFMHVDL